MTNFEIIVNDAIVNGFTSAEKVNDLLANGDDVPFHTFQVWKSMGYMVKKGQHALFVSRIWDKKYYQKIKEWKANHDENSDEEMPRQWKTNAYIFGADQVQPMNKSENVKMVKGEVTAKGTRKAESPKAEKVVKTTRKTKKADKPKTMKQKLAKAKAKEEAKASSNASKVSMKEKYANMEINKPVTVKIEKKAKKTRKAESVKAETPKNEPKKEEPKKTRKNEKYSKDYHILTREGVQKVKGCPFESKKISGLFYRKETFGKQTVFALSDVKSGCYIKSDRKLKDLLAWAESDEVVSRIKESRKKDFYKENCKKLKDGIANLKA